jgi:hypothetical protein
MSKYLDQVSEALETGGYTPEEKQSLAGELATLRGTLTGLISRSSV